MLKLILIRDVTDRGLCLCVQVTEVTQSFLLCIEWYRLKYLHNISYKPRIHLHVSRTVTGAKKNRHSK